MVARVYGKSAQLTVLQRLYYDTAGSANAASFSALMKLVTSKQILFGSDFPFSPNGVKASLDGLRGLGLSDPELQDIEWGNTSVLFSRFTQ